jgi:hypothetical protein
VIVAIVTSKHCEINQVNQAIPVIVGSLCGGSPVAGKHSEVDEGDITINIEVKGVTLEDIIIIEQQVINAYPEDYTTYN